jgi:hypothetical protein
MVEYRESSIISDLDAAYLAGLIDGEGTITLSKIKKSCVYKSTDISVASTTMDLLTFCRDTTNIGFISSKKNYKKHHKPSWTWRSRANQQNLVLLKQIIHYMKEPLKKKRAEKILSELEYLTVRNGRYSDDQKKRKLLFEKEFFEL